MKRQINNGVYLIADPSTEINLLCSKIEKALEGGICAVQLWNHWKNNADKQKIINRVHDLTKFGGIPLILNEFFDFTETSDFEGIHLDKPDDTRLKYLNMFPDLIWGLTCSNNLNDMIWANEHNLDYISFCSMFPSSTSNSCELVTAETVKRANEIFQNPVFLAGGINHQTLPLLKNSRFDGIALVSAIMDSPNPKKEVEIYLKEIKKIQHD
jgi:thiamine-phosphate pyrophosphorylase